jgi:hypothetical protein
MNTNFEPRNARNDTEEGNKMKVGYFSFIMVILVCLGVLVCSCAGPEKSLGGELFAGRWEGDGVDAEGNEFVFAATITETGENRYRVLILESFDAQDPMHVMDGVLEGGRYTYTADEGLYTGVCELAGGMLRGYYKGPVDGSFQMRRVDE